MRKPIIAGNWKLNKTNKETIELLTYLKRDLIDVTEVDVIVCPVFTALSDASDFLSESNTELGAQNIYWEENGAFTGEVSASLLKEVGVKYAIIGHSERRQYFGETNQTVNKKIFASLKNGLIPIVCVGEVLEERESDETFNVLELQCKESLAGLSPEQMKTIIVAYEPVWAIGTGKTASPDQAQEVHQFIRNWIQSNFDEETAEAVRLQYGGSVKPENTTDLMAQPDIDGALVGGASLKSESFVGIIKNSCSVASQK